MVSDLVTLLITRVVSNALHTLCNVTNNTAELDERTGTLAG